MTALRLALALLLWSPALAAAPSVTVEPLTVTEDDDRILPAEEVDGDPQPLKLKPRVVSFNVMVAGKFVTDPCSFV